MEGDLSFMKNIFCKNANYEKVVHNGSDVFTSVEIDVSTNHVQFFKSFDESYNIEYYESKNDKFNFSVQDEKLILKSVYKFKFFNWGFKSREVSQINIYLPMSFNGNIYAHTSTGSVIIDGFNVEQIYIKATTGYLKAANCIINGKFDVITTTGAAEIANIKSQSLVADSTTGKIKISNVTVENDSIIRSSTGSIMIDNFSSNSIECSASTGSIEFGKTICPNINVRTSTGSIKMDIIGNKDDYKADVTTTTGSIKFNGLKVKGKLVSLNGTNSLFAKASTGSITINIHN